MIDQPNNNQGLIFLNSTNNSELVGIHSEFNKNKKRFFISILCGTKNYILNLHNHDYNH